MVAINIRNASLDDIAAIADEFFVLHHPEKLSRGEWTQVDLKYLESVSKRRFSVIARRAKPGAAIQNPNDFALLLDCFAPDGRSQ